MDAIVDGSKTPVVRERDVKVEKPSREEAEAAVRTSFHGPVTIRIAKGLLIRPSALLMPIPSFLPVTRKTRKSAGTHF